MAGVTTPSTTIIEVPSKTKIRSNFFRILDVSSVSLIFRDLSSSGDGTFSLKLEMRWSDSNWFGKRLACAYLHINEYRANIPPVKNHCMD